MNDFPPLGSYLDTYGTGPLPERDKAAPPSPLRGRVTEAGKLSKAFNSRSHTIKLIAIAAIGLALVGALALTGVIGLPALHVLGSCGPEIFAIAAAGAGGIALLAVALVKRSQLHAIATYIGDKIRSKRVPSSDRLQKLEAKLIAKQVELSQKNSHLAVEKARLLRGAKSLLDPSQRLGGSTTETILALHPAFRNEGVKVHDLTLTNDDRGFIQNPPTITPKDSGYDVLLFTVGSLEGHIVTAVVDHANKRIEYYDPRGWSFRDRGKEIVRACGVNLSGFMKSTFPQETFKEYSVWQNDRKHQTDTHSCGVLALTWVKERLGATRPDAVQLETAKVTEYRERLVDEMDLETFLVRPYGEAGREALEGLGEESRDLPRRAEMVDDALHELPGYVLEGRDLRSKMSQGLSMLRRGIDKGEVTVEDLGKPITATDPEPLKAAKLMFQMTKAICVVTDKRVEHSEPGSMDRRGAAKLRREGAHIEESLYALFEKRYRDDFDTHTYPTVEELGEILYSTAVSLRETLIPLHEEVDRLILSERLDILDSKLTLTEGIQEDIQDAREALEEAERLPVDALLKEEKHVYEALKVNFIQLAVQVSNRERTFNKYAQLDQEVFIEDRLDDLQDLADSLLSVDKVVDLFESVDKAFEHLDILREFISNAEQFLKETSLSVEAVSETDSDAESVVSDGELEVASSTSGVSSGEASESFVDSMMYPELSDTSSFSSLEEALSDEGVSSEARTPPPRKKLETPQELAEATEKALLDLQEAIVEIRTDGFTFKRPLKVEDGKKMRVATPEEVKQAILDPDFIEKIPRAQQSLVEGIQNALKKLDHVSLVQEDFVHFLESKGKTVPNDLDRDVEAIKNQMAETLVYFFLPEEAVKGPLKGKKIALEGATPERFSKYQLTLATKKVIDFVDTFENLVIRELREVQPTIPAQEVTALKPNKTFAITPQGFAVVTQKVFDAFAQVNEKAWIDVFEPVTPEGLSLESFVGKPDLLIKRAEKDPVVVAVSAFDQLIEVRQAVRLMAAFTRDDAEQEEGKKLGEELNKASEEMIRVLGDVIENRVEGKRILGARKVFAYLQEILEKAHAYTSKVAAKPPKELHSSATVIMEAAEQRRGCERKVEGLEKMAELYTLYQDVLDGEDLQLVQKLERGCLKSVEVVKAWIEREDPVPHGLKEAKERADLMLQDARELYNVFVQDQALGFRGMVKECRDLLKDLPESEAAKKVDALEKRAKKGPKNLAVAFKELQALYKELDSLD
jgi:hypothetical protein